MSNYREMLEDYRDVDIDELMKGLTEEELQALDEELERDVIQPNPSYSLRAPTPPPELSDEDSSEDEAPPEKPQQKMVGIPAPLYKKLIEEGKGHWIEHPSFGRIFQPDLSHVPAELLRPAPVDHIKRIEREAEANAEANAAKTEWMEKQLQSVQIDTDQVFDEDQNGVKLQEQINRLQSIPKRKEESKRQFTNKVDRALNQVKSGLQQVDHDEIQRFKEEHHEEDLSDDELVNPNSPEELLSRAWENDPELTTINLNNILNIPVELLEELMEALEENVYVRELSLVNTGLLDRIAIALAKTIKRNRTLEKVSVESNFITGDGAVKMIKALQKNEVLTELRIDNQRHIFGQNVEQEFVKYLRHNETLTRFGYQFGNAGHRMTCNNYLTRNTDKKRRERVALNRAMGKRPEARKQIRVVSSKKRKDKTMPKDRQFQSAPTGQIPLPRRVTEHENDLGDAEISAIFDKMDTAEMAKLEEWFKYKNGGPSGNGAQAPPPPPPASIPAVRANPKPSSKTARNNLLGDISTDRQLRKVIAPEQKLVIPEAIGTEEKNRFARKASEVSEEDSE